MAAALTGEQRYILDLLARGADYRLRVFDLPHGSGLGIIRPVPAGGKHLPLYRVSRDDARALTAAGYLRPDPSSGGCPEITDLGRQFAQAAKREETT